MHKRRICRICKEKCIKEGRKEDFKDVFSLKYFIRDYAKYLGLDGEALLDEFNEAGERGYQVENYIGQEEILDLFYKIKSLRNEGFKTV